MAGLRIELSEPAWQSEALAGGLRLGLASLLAFAQDRQAYSLFSSWNCFQQTWRAPPPTSA